MYISAATCRLLKCFAELKTMEVLFSCVLSLETLERRPNAFRRIARSGACATRTTLRYDNVLT